MALSGSRAIVTGAGQGIGKQIATELAARGADVLIFELNAETAASAAQEISAAYPDRTVSSYAGSVVEPSNIAEAFGKAESDLGGTVDLLVNNAGFGELSLITDTTDEQWLSVVNLCLNGPFFVSREFGKRLIDSGGRGAVVNISSLNYTAATEGLASYCAAKAGVSQFTKCAAAEWGRHGIRVNAIAPGLIATDLTRNSGLTDGLSGENFLVRTPMGRVGETTDVALAAAMLLSEDAGWVTGVTLSVDGGNHIKGLHSYWDVISEMMAEAAAQ